jgi:hypothetical protein
MARRQGGLQHARRAHRAILLPTVETEAPSWWTLSSVEKVRQGLTFVAQAVLAGKLAARDANAVTATLQATLQILTRHRDLLPAPPMPAAADDPMSAYHLSPAQRERVRDILTALVDRVRGADDQDAPHDADSAGVR